MNRRSPLSWLLGLCVAMIAFTSQGAFAAAKRALFVSINGSYNADGVNMYNELNSYVTATHGVANQVDYVLLSSNGLVAQALAANTYEQVWVYDLSVAADNYPTDYQAILAWYNQAPLKEIICDGRYLSSFWSSRFSTEGRKVTQNYYYNLMIRGGGIVLATDHNDFANAGMNVLANVLGIGPFTGNFGGNFPLDAGHPLTTEPNTLTSLFNDSSTSQAPFGLQPGGRTLRTLGYHSGVATNPGISTTIDGGVLGITVEIAEEGGLLCEGSKTFNASITQGSEFGPFTYEWRVNNEVVGTGTTFTFNGEVEGEGTYEVKVIGQGAGLRADDDLVTLTVGGVGCIRCGNEVIDAGESCDDGNTDDDDGCSADCLLEIGAGPCEGNDQCVAVAICFDATCIPRCFGDLDCNDGNSCSSDLCDEETGICSNAFAAPGATCDEGVCTNDGECVGCFVGTGPIDVGCTESSPICLVGEGGASCVDCLEESDCPHVTCAVSVCTDNACIDLPIEPTPTTCGEGTCSNAGFIVCRNDESVVECEPRPDGSTCDAGFCALAASCDEGVCTVDDYRTCDDDNPCTVDSCDEELGRCSNVIVEAGTLCDTGVCSASGVCVGCIVAAGPVDVGCTAASPMCLVGEGGATCVECLAASDCPHVTCAVSTCSDNTCIDAPIEPSPTTCGEGTCASEGFIVCREDELIVECEPRPDGTPCDAGFCALAAFCDEGICDVDSFRSCDDGNPCTVDFCDPASGSCIAEAAVDETPCEDGNLCTVSDRCTGGTCVGQGVACELPGECELPATCNPATGICDFPRVEGCRICSDDAVAPTITCPQPRTGVECVFGGVAVLIGSPSTSDECSTPLVVSDAPSVYEWGTTQVTFSAFDEAGNTASCTTAVEIRDTEPPTVFCPDETTVQGDAGVCGAFVALDMTAVDDCDGVTLSFIGSDEAFYPPGRTSAVVAAVDRAGNQTVCETTVNVVGLDTFEIECMDELIVDAPPTFCGYPERIDAELFDTCASAVTIQSGSDAFPIGETTVTFSATRESDGKEATCATRLEVRDVTPPEVSCGNHEGRVLDLVAVLRPNVADVCDAATTFEGVACVRTTGSETVALTERCDIGIESGAIFVRDAPASAGGDVSVVYTVVAVDPSGNETRLQCEAQVDPESLDHDGDGLLDRDDNCPETYNPDQVDTDLDGPGDVCDDVDYTGLVAEGSGGCAGGNPGGLVFGLLTLIGLLGLTRLIRRRRRLGLGC